jgi:hypothetical protein
LFQELKVLLPEEAPKVIEGIVAMTLAPPVGL